MAGTIKAKPRKRGRRGALQVYDALREEILWVRIAPGTALDEHDLAARFEVSRTPIREALLLLAGERLVQLLPNRTSIVAPFSLDNAGDYLDTALIISRAMARAAALLRPGRVGGAERAHAALRQRRGGGRLGSVAQGRAGCACAIWLNCPATSFLIKFFGEVMDAGMRMWVLHYVPNVTADERRASVGRMEALTDVVLAGDADASDRAIETMLLAGSAIVARSLKPRFGAEMRLGRFGKGFRAL